MNPDPDHTDVFLQALRHDVPSNEADNGMRTRLRAAGMLLAPTSVQATTLAATGTFGAEAQASGALQSTGTASLSVGSPAGAGAASGASAISTSTSLVWATLSGTGAKLVGIGGVLAIAGGLTWTDPHEGSSEDSSNEVPSSGEVRAPTSDPASRPGPDAPPRTVSTQSGLLQVKRGITAAPTAPRQVHRNLAFPGKNSKQAQRTRKKSASKAAGTLPGQTEKTAQTERGLTVLGPEANLLHQALSALQQGDLRQAGRYLEDHEKTFPQGVLVKERQRTKEKLTRALQKAR